MIGYDSFYMKLLFMNFYYCKSREKTKKKLENTLEDCSFETNQMTKNDIIRQNIIEKQHIQRTSLTKTSSLKNIVMKNMTQS